MGSQLRLPQVRNPLGTEATLELIGYVIPGKASPRNTHYPTGHEVFMGGFSSWFIDFSLDISSMESFSP